MISGISNNFPFGNKVIVLKEHWFDPWFGIHPSKGEW